MKTLSRIVPLLFFSACVAQPADTPKSVPGTEAAPEQTAEPDRRLVEIASPDPVAQQARVQARYETKFLDPELEAIRNRDKKWQADQDDATSEIRKRQKERDEKKRREKLVLRSSLPADQIPPTLDLFKAIPHQPPVAQYYTGTCWSFATTSFLESEIQRIAGKSIKLSELATVYFEYLAKAARYVKERGDSHFSEGSEANAVSRIISRYGLWPESVFPGVLEPDGKHDHLRLYREMEKLLLGIKDAGMWDENTTRGMIRVLLDRQLGTPPEHFTWEGREFTPMRFMSDATGIAPDSYVEFMSTLKIPFYTRGEFEVPDNWWHADSYHNIPLDVFYATIKKAVQAGYSLVIAIDVSEPGVDGPNDSMFIPDYDIPADHIDQLAREYRMDSGVTTDDHGVHLIGYARHKDHDWFLVKDSGRSSRRGKHKGYYFVRGDYLKLKVMAFTVHRDAVADLLAKFPKATNQASSK